MGSRDDLKKMNETISLPFPRVPRKLLGELERPFGSDLKYLNEYGYEWLLRTLIRSLKYQECTIALPLTAGSQFVRQGHIFANELSKEVAKQYFSFQPHKMLQEYSETDAPRQRLYSVPSALTSDLSCISVPNAWEYLALAATLSRCLARKKPMKKLGKEKDDWFLPWPTEAIGWHLSSEHPRVSTADALRCLKILSDPFSSTDCELSAEKTLFDSATGRLTQWGSIERYLIVERLCVEILIGCWATVPLPRFNELHHRVKNSYAEFMENWNHIKFNIPNTSFMLAANTKDYWHAWNGLMLLTLEQWDIVENWRPFAISRSISTAEWEDATELSCCAFKLG